MRITPPHAEIDLYKDGFQKHDLLNRSVQGRHLSDLVEKVDESLVISLDGAWGSGKSFFLKCWVGEHANSDGAATPIYFDAFENDFIDDPLLGLTGMLSDRLEATNQHSKAVKFIKSAAAKFSRPALRIALAAGTAGASEVAGVVVDAALETGSKELEAQVNEFWKKEDGRRAAMAEFRSAMVKLTEPDEDGKPTKKFVFVVDELDRCRPDFALDTLEVIKHFFNVPGVHFVLGINFKELLNTVRCRYGNGIDAATYLEKFITVSMTLPDLHLEGVRPQKSARIYFEKMTKKMSLPEELSKDILWWSDNFPTISFTSIRQSQKILSEVALVADQEHVKKMFVGWRLTLAALIILKHRHPGIFEKAKDKTLTFDEVRTALDLPLQIDQDAGHHIRNANIIWGTILSTATEKEIETTRGIWGTFGLDNPSEVPRTLIRDYIDPIQLTSV